MDTLITGYQKNTDQLTTLLSSISIDNNAAAISGKRKCDKCGKIIQGGRIKLIQHKKEFHSPDDVIVMGLGK
jgi:hypothetical protein